MNLPFSIENDDLQKLFEKYGKIEEIEIPIKRGQKTGYAFIKFETSESAITAYASVDKSYFQGRKIHILPAQKKPIVIKDLTLQND